MTRYISSLIVFLLVSAAYLMGGLEPLEHALMDMRLNMVKRDASGSIVIVEIDARSLRELNSWPWPRRHHAELIERLQKAGARDIAFDIDFSSRSTPVDDRKFAASLHGMHGRVILPAFKQIVNDPAGGRSAVHSAPLEIFARHARHGLVNVVVEGDGRVRRYALHDNWKQLELQSMAAALAGKDTGSSVDFLLDFGIRAGTVPRLSYVDVLRGDFDPAVIDGRAVIVGATAVELGDNMTVPVYNVLSGVVLQALAYESIVQGRMLYRSPAGPVLLAALLLAFFLGPRFSGWSWKQGLVIACGAVSFAVFVPLAVQAVYPIGIDAAPLILVPLLGYAVGLWRLIDNQAWSIFRHHLNAMHGRAMFRSVVDDSFDGIVIVDQDGVIEVFNASAEEIFGKPAEEAIGTPIAAYLPDPEGLNDVDPGTGAGMGHGHVHREFTLEREDGAKIDIELTVSTSKLSISNSPMERRRESRIVQIYTFRNVTERKRTEQAQQRALEEASAANRAKTEFLANMSHELRTPLNAVIGFSEIMKSQVFGPLGADVYEEYIGDIHSSGKHLLAIINDILDMSKIEAGEMTVSDEIVELPEVMESCLRLIADRAHKGNVEISFDVAQDLSSLRADGRMIKQILLNLLSNAVKFTPEGGRVTVGVALDPEGGMVVSVADTGIGISSADLETVLRPFGQADASLQRQYEGTGLGLPLVNAMAELHDAKLNIDSAPGEGTTVTIRFPAGRVVRHEAEKAA